MPTHGHVSQVTGYRVREEVRFNTPPWPGRPSDDPEPHKTPDTYRPDARVKMRDTEKLNLASTEGYAFHSKPSAGERPDNLQPDPRPGLALSHLT